MNYNLMQFPWTEINCSSAPVSSSSAPPSSFRVVVSLCGVWYQVTVFGDFSVCYCDFLFT